MSANFARRLQAMLGRDAGVGRAEVAGEDGLFPEEAAAVARAISNRRAEFAAGRRAARAALAALGMAETAIPTGATCEPLWPSGISGAITHDCGLALAAVSRTGGIGLDLTEAAPLPGDTRRTILPHAAEAGLEPLAERAGFSAKESLFKALFSVVGAHFGFSAALVRPDPAAGRFEIELVEPLGPVPAGMTWTGHIYMADGLLMTALRVRNLT